LLCSTSRELSLATGMFTRATLTGELATLAAVDQQASRRLAAATIAPRSSKAYHRLRIRRAIVRRLKRVWQRLQPSYRQNEER
jgi:hypothetical protein